MLVQTGVSGRRHPHPCSAVSPALPAVGTANIPEQYNTTLPSGSGIRLRAPNLPEPRREPPPCTNPALGPSTLMCVRTSRSQPRVLVAGASLNISSMGGQM